MTNAVILSACRTPIGSFGGALKDLSAADLGAIVIREAIARAGIGAADLGDVIMGCVLQGGAGMNVARQAAIKAGVPVEVPAETINRVCGSGLQAVVHAVEAVKAGYVDLILAGGTESMSNAPYIMRGARWGYRMGNGELIDSLLAEGLTCAIKGCHMGNTAEEIVKRFDVEQGTTPRAKELLATDEQLAEFFAPNGYDEHELQNPVFYDWDGLKGRALSSSYAPLPGHERHDEMITALREVYDRHHEGGQVRMDYVTRVYVGRL